jgi:hypothetical protein
LNPSVTIRGSLSTPGSLVYHLMLIPTSWLFVKGDESVWIYRPTLSDLLICGPRTERSRWEFPSAGGLEAYQADLASDLLEAGWELLGEGYERRRRRRTDPLAVPPTTPPERSEDDR